MAGIISGEIAMGKRFPKIVPFDPRNVEFVQAPYDGPIAVEQRLRNLVLIAIEIQTGKATPLGHENVDTSDAEGVKVCRQ